MRAPCRWEQCGGRILSITCAAKRIKYSNGEPSVTVNDTVHLRRTLDVDSACQQALDFEYVAVAFRSRPRPAPENLNHVDGALAPEHKAGVSTTLGSHRTPGYRTLEVISGDPRLLFEPLGDSAAAPACTAALPGAADSGAQRIISLGLSRQDGARCAPAASQRRQTQPTRQPVRQSRQDAAIAGGATSAIAAVPTRRCLSDRPDPSGSLLPVAPFRAVPMEAAAAGQELILQQETRGPGGAESSRRTVSAHGAHHAVRRAAADQRLATAAALLKLSPRELCRHVGFCSELRALQLAPTALAGICGVLVELLGLAPQQLREALLRQPHVLRVPPDKLAGRGAALALELQLPPPPGPGGGGPLAAIVAAVPDVLLRRAGYAGTAAALAAALAMPPGEAVALLRREPQLLRHPPGYYARGVAQLAEQLGMAAAAAAALAVSEPQLLAVSPGVLRANGTLLRSRLQLRPQQLAEVVAHAPELLVCSPGVLRSVVQRLTAVLGRSDAWRAALLRLLASPHNLAVALSFSSDRYDRLEYLACTGRDRVVDFKQGLSLEDAEFRELFPEYRVNVWRQQLQLHAGPHHPQQPHQQPQPLGRHATLYGNMHVRTQSPAAGSSRVGARVRVHAKSGR